MSDPTPAPSPGLPPFRQLGLSEPLLQALAEVGYETPSPIQAATIPPLLAGRDVLGQAQTGTGKTAAFALPILSRLDLSRSKPQALVLAPTRELAIQVAEAFQRYASKLPGFHVLPIYGGQSYGPQLSGLKRGAQVIVGTPGRVIDHLGRGSLDLSALTTLVLDEADEMLRMGFIDDVEAVLEKIPPERQVALFSATMPAPIRRIAQAHLQDPVEIAIKAKTTTATNIRQRYWYVSGVQKLDALTRILEAEPFDAMLVFTRTRQSTEELAQKLQARGFAAVAINGDMVQAQRERTIQQLKDGRIDILVATDVAARGLDVERISHVLNFDIPTDTEAYVHRIGRTGRAGRSGEAILFVAPREKRLLQAIERATRQPIEEMRLPSVEAVNDRRITRFKERIDSALAADDLGPFRQLVEQFEQERNVPAIEVAAALARLVQGERPLLLSPPPRGERAPPPAREERGAHPSAPHGAHAPPARGRPNAGERAAPPHQHSQGTPFAAPAGPQTRARKPPTPDAGTGFVPSARPPRREDAARATPDAHATAAGTHPRDGVRPPRSHHEDARRARPPRREGAPHVAEPGFETFRIEVGEEHGVKPANIVGAIANEAGLDSKHIGRVAIHHDHSTVDLPEGMPPEIFKHLKRVWVSGQQLRITRASGADEAAPRQRGRPPRPPSFGDGSASPKRHARKPRPGK